MGYKAKGDEIMDTPLDIIFTKENFLPVFNQDIIDAQKEILIVSPFIRRRRTRQMIRYLNAIICKPIRVTVVTRPKEDFPEKVHMALQRAQDLITESGINIIFKANIHQKFATMDQRIVWYGSINLLSYGSAQESIMRI